MVTRLAASGRLGIGLVALAAGLVGLLLLVVGAGPTLDLVRTGLVAVLYVLLPLAVVAGLLKVFFAVNAWLQ